jgi:hypothetical protein
MTIGVLMLDTQFQRFAGDIGNPQSFGDQPVLFERVTAATAQRIVGLTDDSFVEPFVAAAERLIARGATAITTSCGFLVLCQRALAARLPVPVATSALLLAPSIKRALPPGQRLGILTFSAANLTAAHLIAAGADPATPVEGLAPGCTFQRAVFEDTSEDSFAARDADVTATARRLVQRHPDVGAILLECTNFPPHRAAIERATGLPVHDIFDVVALLRQGLTPPA